MKAYVTSKPLVQILKEHPYAEDFFTSVGIRNCCSSRKICEFLNSLSDDFIEDCGMERAQILNHFITFMEKMSELKQKATYMINEITVLGGRDKSGNEENIGLTMKPGEIICIVGPTGIRKWEGDFLVKYLQIATGRM